MFLETTPRRRVPEASPRVVLRRAFLGGDLSPRDWGRAYLWAVTGAALSAVVLAAGSVGHVAYQGGRSSVLRIVPEVMLLAGASCWLVAFATAWPMFAAARVSARAFRIASPWHELVWGAATRLAILFLLAPNFVWASGYAVAWSDFAKAAPFFAIGGAGGAVLSWWMVVRRTGERTR